jgi:penicillin-insensitive murein endopeptidase
MWKRLRQFLTFSIAATLVAPGALAEPAAKTLFGSRQLPAVMKPAAHGFYSKGCLAGGIAVPTDGPTWQAMRLSRNRRWGHPDTVKTVVQLSQDAQKVGWNGLLVGDISQPRGGPMLSGHASHQLGLDADIWLTEMPERTLSYKEREELGATTMLATKNGKLDQSRIGSAFTQETFGLIKTAAAYKQVERVLVHPVIKAELCKREKGEGAERRWLHKVRPYWGHHYHMHVRLSCPAGSPQCRAQAKPRADDGCGKEVKDWLALLNPKKPKVKVKPKPKASAKKKPVRRKPKPQITMAQLPAVCRAVLNGPQPAKVEQVELQLAGGRAVVPQAEPVPTPQINPFNPFNKVTLPKFRPTANDG